jgi:hypothetical protein
MRTVWSELVRNDYFLEIKSSGGFGILGRGRHKGDPDGSYWPGSTLEGFEHEQDFDEEDIDDDGVS